MLDVTLNHQDFEFDSLPFGPIEEAIELIKDVVIRDDSQAIRIILLLAGVWRTDDLAKPYALLPWSPLTETIPDFSAVNLAHIATQRILDGVASAVLYLDSTSWTLFKQKYPRPCPQYLLKGDFI